MKWLVVCCGLQLLAHTTLAGQDLYLPPELARAGRVPVEGRPEWRPGKPVKFAEYIAERTTSQWEQPPTGPGSETLAFRVEVKGRGGWRADCAPVTVVKKGKPPEKASELHCKVAPENGDTSQVWRLDVRTTKGAMPKGKLSRGRLRLDVEGTNNLQDKKVAPGDRPAGFHLLLEGQAVAAVELFGDGAVWFDTGLPRERRDAMAVVAAATFLWDDLVYPPR
jgi:hypothetical protein